MKVEYSFSAPPDLRFTIVNLGSGLAYPLVAGYQSSRTDTHGVEVQLAYEFEVWARSKVQKKIMPLWTYNVCRTNFKTRSVHTTHVTSNGCVALVTILLTFVFSVELYNSFLLYFDVVPLNWTFCSRLQIIISYNTKSFDSNARRR